MNSQLVPGLEAETSYVIEEKHLASIVGSGLVSVYSTAMMIGGMESAAVEAVQKFLPAGYTTVGIHVDVEHKAATPLGMKVRFRARLLEISANSRGLKFHVEAYDEKELIGEGTHWRVVVLQEKFERKALAKMAAHSS